MMAQGPLSHLGAASLAHVSVQSALQRLASSRHALPVTCFRSMSARLLQIQSGNGQIHGESASVCLSGSARLSHKRRRETRRGGPSPSFSAKPRQKRRKGERGIKGCTAHHWSSPPPLLRALITLHFHPRLVYPTLACQHAQEAKLQLCREV